MLLQAKVVWNGFNLYTVIKKADCISQYWRGNFFYPDVLESMVLDLNIACVVKNPNAVYKYTSATRFTVVVSLSSARVLGTRCTSLITILGICD